MKNANYIETINKCFCCKRGGFFVETPSGGDYNTCPLCGAYDYDGYNNTEYYHHELNFCGTCCIMYDIGCTHASIGCTDDVYNGHVIGKWKHKTTDIIYNGMPQFDRVREWKDNAMDVEILDIVCLNNNYHCDESYHTILVHCKHAISSKKSEPLTSFNFDL